MFGKSQEIADLQAALTVAIGERDSLATAALTHEAAINALTAERDAAVAQVATAQAAVAEAEKNAAARIAEFEAASTGQRSTPRLSTAWHRLELIQSHGSQKPVHPPPISFLRKSSTSSHQAKSQPLASLADASSNQQFQIKHHG
jgi:hypothetical protein